MMQHTTNNIPMKKAVKKVEKFLEEWNRTTMDAFKVVAAKDEGDDIDRIYINIKNNKLFWLHLISFNKELEKIGFHLSWMSRDSFKDQKTQFRLMLIRDRRKNG